MDTISLSPDEQRSVLALHLPALLAVADTICNTPEMSEAPLPPVFAHIYGGVPRVRLGDLLRCWTAEEESPWRYTNEQGHACYRLFSVFGLSGCLDAVGCDAVTGLRVTPPRDISSFVAWGTLKKYCRKPVCAAPLRLEQVIARLAPQPRLIVHVPHASAKLLKHCGLSVMPAEQERLARHSAALYTDKMVPEGSFSVIAPLSRLVVDTALEATDAEAVPTRAYDGSIIRASVSDKRFRRLLNVHHHPQRECLRRYVRASLAVHGTARLLDLRSYPASFRLPEAVGTAQPDVCITFDSAHCPAASAQVVADAAHRHGLTADFNNPYEGSCVPRDFHGNTHVLFLALHLKRSCYMDELTLRPHAGLSRLRAFVSETAELLRSSPMPTNPLFSYREDAPERVNGNDD